MLYHTGTKSPPEIKSKGQSFGEKSSSQYNFIHHANEKLAMPENCSSGIKVTDSNQQHIEPKVTSFQQWVIYE